MADIQHEIEAEETGFKTSVGPIELDDRPYADDQDMKRIEHELERAKEKYFRRELADYKAGLSKKLVRPRNTKASIRAVLKKHFKPRRG